MRTNRHFLTASTLILLGLASADAHDLVLANGRVMDPATGLDAVRHLGIRDGKVVTISEIPLTGRETHPGKPVLSGD